MKVLVTGGSGFLGSHVAEQLSSQGHQVRCLVRKSSDTKFLKTLANVELADGAVEDAQSVGEATRGVDAVIHAAGLVKARGVPEFQKINVDGTANMLGAARSHGIKRFVYVSSQTVAGPSFDGKPVAEDALGPLTHYGRSKLAAENLVRAASAELPVVILRPPFIYGPRDPNSLAFFKSVKTGVLPFLGGGKNTLSVIYVTDCAKACIRALDAAVPSGSTYFLEDGNVYMWRDMVGEIEKAMGKKALIRFSVPMFVLQAAAFSTEMFGKVTNRAVILTRDKVHELAAPHWVCDASKARNELGWKAEVDWSRGVKEAADWYKSAGWL